MVLVIDLDVYSLRPSIPYHSGNGFHGDVMGCTEESSCKIWGYIHFLYMYITDVLIFKYIYIYIQIGTTNSQWGYSGDIPSHGMGTRQQ